MPDPDLPGLPELSGLRDLPVAPPPAAQIRRRGDQRRHRTQLLGVAGVAVVVALIVAPLTVFSRSDHSAPPPPIATDTSTPSPTRPAARRLPASKPALTPEGYGRLKLGMTQAQAEAAGAITRVSPPRAGGCGTFDLAGTKDDPNLVDGYISPQGKISIIAAQRGITTPEGAKTGITRAVLEQIYPDGHIDNGYWIVVPPAHPDRHYEFGLEGNGKIGEILLKMDDGGSCS